MCLFSRKAKAFKSPAGLLEPHSEIDNNQEHPRGPDQCPNLTLGKEGRQTCVVILPETEKSRPAINPLYKSKPVNPKRQEIRLLNVLPGQDPDPIRCTLHSTSLRLKSPTPYETISYCWGENPGSAEAVINEVVVQVTQSAANVIRRVRYPDKNRMIWIDAICINQENDEERKQQVMFMDEIYRKTWRNLIWLGEETGDVVAIKVALGAVVGNIRQTTNDYKDLFKVMHTKSAKPRLTRDGALLDRTIDLLPLIKLFSSPWFSRLWVVQEAILPHQSLCLFGPAGFALIDVLRVSVWLVWNLKYVPAQVLAISGLYYASNIWCLADREAIPLNILRGYTNTLLTTYDRLKEFNASDPRDNIYTLLGVRSCYRPKTPGRAPILAPDYRVATEAKDVFQVATRIMIEEARSLRVLHNRSSFEGPSLHLDSSWAVDFSYKWDQNPGPEPFSLFFNANNDIRLTQSTTVFRKHPEILSLRGIHVDEVFERTDCVFTWNQGPFSSTFCQIIVKAYSVGERIPGRNMQEELAYTLMGATDSALNPACHQDMQEYDAFVQYMLEHSATPPAINDFEAKDYDEDTQMAIRYFGAVRRACVGRRFFVTKGGRIGVGPPDMRDNDVIAILYGGIMPFILRRAGKDRYQFVGECYVHGIMYGEAMQANIAGEKTDIVFHII